MRSYQYLPNTVPVQLGRNLYYLRTTTGLTHAQLAEAIGVSYGSIRDWEAGRSMPNEGSLDLLRQYFGDTAFLDVERIADHLWRRRDQRNRAMMRRRGG